MKKFLPIVIAIVASVILVFNWSSGNLETIKLEQKPESRSRDVHQETRGEDFESDLERLKREVAETESAAPATGREKRRYSADSVESNLADGTLALKGRAWHRDGTSLIDGRDDPRSTMTLDATTLNILEKSGRFESMELIDPNQ